jgi:hypothetical protein
LCLGLLLLLASPDATARKFTVSLVSVRGPGAADLADALEWALAERYKYVPGEVYLSAARRLNAAGPSPEEIRKAAGALRIDALVAGRVAEEDGGRVVLLQVRSGHTGESVAKVRIPIGMSRPSEAKDEIIGAVVAAVDKIARAPVLVAKPKPNEPVTDDEPEPEPEHPVDAKVAREAPQLPLAVVRGVEIGIGPSLIGRRLGFDNTAAPGYVTGILPGLRVDAAVFPFALNAEFAWAHPILANIGVLGGYETAFNVVGSLGNISTPGRADRFYLALAGRIPLGRRRLAGQLTVDLEFAELRWSHVAGQDLGVPDVGYQTLGAGVALSQPLGTRYIVLNLRFAAAGLMDAGNIDDVTQYGPMQGYSIEAEGGLTAWPLHNLWLRLGARYTRIGMSINGQGTRFARAGTDEWVSGMLEVGGAL